MNVMGYVGKFDEATTAAYLREHKLGMAAVQQNVTYKRELLAGDTVTVRSACSPVSRWICRPASPVRYPRCSWAAPEN